jgi:hypothetical protein
MASSGGHLPAAAGHPAAPASGEGDHGDAADPDQPIPPDPGKVTDFELGDDLCEGG